MEMIHHAPADESMYQEASGIGRILHELHLQEYRLAILMPVKQENKAKVNRDVYSLV